MFRLDWRAYGNLATLRSEAPVALSLGNFDGVHLGHRHLLASLKALAAGRPTVVMTFFPHPTKLFVPGMKSALLCSLDERVQQILDFGIDTVLVQNFSMEFSQLGAREFCTDVLCRNLTLSKVLLGFDFRFGKDRKGDFDVMKAIGRAQGFEVFREEAFERNGCVVSSSEIRRLISNGEMETAEIYLTRPFSLAGVVIKGDQRGRLLGYPTVNLGHYDLDMILPLSGVYAGYVAFDDGSMPLPAVMSFGVRPTFGANLEYRAEAHIFNFSADVYGKAVRFIVKHRLRGEERFSDVRDLKAQMARDSQLALSLLEK